MARDCTESRFWEVLARCGGPQRVLLVGELWERAESRAVLEGFLRALFPDQSQDPVAHRPARFSLVFFLCRAESLRLREARGQLREILRDVKERTPGGGAVIGVIIPPDSPDSETPGHGPATDSEPPGHGSATDSEPPGHGLDSAPGELSAMLDLLQSVFPPGKGRWPEVRAAVLLPGKEESRREVQRAACEALTAADLQRNQKKESFLPRFFSCRRRRRRRRDPVLKDNPEEGTALTVLNHSNGDYAKSTSDA
ncbi:Hypothetical predicted protein [Pelobates cultripes]|uniref:Uncharacterized protein n=1 Tax=Pelobates cultripes TaxID=61616 RepID=A0AAD1RCP4_PELCU|nr:Hypothetical predicted protein [Pelobates cultripes]